MSAAVVRVMVDGDGQLTSVRYAAGIARLEGLGYDVVASPPQNLPERRREIELIIDDDKADGGGVDPAPHVAACAQAFGTDATLGVITYISRGTDDDARGVLRRFGLKSHGVREFIDGTDEVVTVTILQEDSRRVPESRLHTALEAALNCDVRVVVPASPR